MSRADSLRTAGRQATGLSAWEGGTLPGRLVQAPESGRFQQYSYSIIISFKLTACSRSENLAEGAEEAEERSEVRGEVLEPRTPRSEERSEALGPRRPRRGGPEAAGGEREGPRRGPRPAGERESGSKSKCVLIF